MAIATRWVMRVVGTTAAVGALAVAAFTVVEAGQGRGHGFGDRSGFGVMAGLRGLNLTDAQREQVRGIVQQNRDQTKPIGARLAAAHQALQAAIAADQVDEGQIRARSAELAAAQADMAVARAHIRQQIEQVLTPEQQQKARELREQRQQRFKARGQQQPPPGQ